MNASWNGLTPNPLLSAGRILATTSEDNTVRLWDVAARKELRTLRGHTDAVYGASWSPDGASLLSAGSDGNIVLWDPHAGVKKSVHLPTTHNPPRLKKQHPSSSRLEFPDPISGGELRGWCHLVFPAFKPGPIHETVSKWKKPHAQCLQAINIGPEGEQVLAPSFPAFSPTLLIPQPRTRC